ncbi:hypothetical protein CVIRNUC_007089 [Coccomyxa viridis]|uniref:Uncharacterized protein n=1 Tax=Coccomyxa viridis TaxID=1274662 RepID=A0AAV1ID31_9CHLO|nr:hypothetical protein CVIRNUC_007089 [Coccomyxa viridis]
MLDSHDKALQLRVSTDFASAARHSRSKDAATHTTDFLAERAMAGTGTPALAPAASACASACFCAACASACFWQPGIV